mmetsp:Transcript_36085/g.115877  ORF Transcript_36085/g.115877 Transcript_36085/m.115877 type:complete len:82 (+) Transcript_36085:972-1217(+)
MLAEEEETRLLLTALRARATHHSSLPVWMIPPFPCSLVLRASCDLCYFRRSFLMRLFSCDEEALGWTVQRVLDAGCCSMFA